MNMDSLRDWGQRHGMRIIFIPLLLAYSVSHSAQAGLGAAGGHEVNDNYMLNYSVGQVFNTVIEESDIYISQGIQHPSLLVIDGNGSGELPETDSLVMVFPNPVKEELCIYLMHSVPQEFQVQLVDMNGKLLMRKKFESDKLRLPMFNIASGSYLLFIRSGSNVAGTFTIIKTK